ncbi:leucyl aminopeptidase [Maritimibacter sp. 55A14]|uniref:leucyl aminopeptidase n=1 Tax=Maritimibacter sp. 55A14 TaxID=2174844 RepID=UPI000D614080|nr:leucyl aminopeptidase [Maritimibacter sp. 55A14]PWE34163.1 leucyl aminopeptidase [Maritimibacter sp. 55A14]
MTDLVAVDFTATDLDRIAAAEGRVAVLITPDGKLDQGARRVNRLTKGALARFVESKPFEKLSEGAAQVLAYPTGLAAEAVIVVKLSRRPDTETARKAGAALARNMGEGALLALAGNTQRCADIAYGLMLTAYDFTDHKTGEAAEKTRGAVTVMASKPEEVAEAAETLRAVAEGVFFTRDLVNAPANVLTTTEFAARVADMEKLGLIVEVLEEKELEELGMRALLAVGQGSESPSRVAVMEWRGGGDEAPLALVGKGVVFDTGGISIKPSAGMEEMTMDMGGAGVVSGVMRAVARRKARANVVGLIGLVENMPDGRAQRPGDVVVSMKGDTIEVINTDAEGRLVLADVLWYAQERFKPSGVIDLATLTGAIIVGLGNENTGVFSNDDAFCVAFLKAAAAESEGAWRMPMGPAYDKLIKSRIADIKNSAGRPAGSITAAQFLGRFVKDDMPWIHLDIAGTALVKEDTALAPKGATGWGVRALDRLIRDRYES